MNIVYLRRARTLNDLLDSYILLTKYFQQRDIIPSNEFVFYAENYHKLFPGENFFVYLIKQNFKTVGTIIGVKSNNLIVIDYLVVDKDYRKNALLKGLGKIIINKLKKYNLPIVAEAESNTLCRLYRLYGFKRFEHQHKYFMLELNLLAKTSQVYTNESNLLYLSDTDLNYYQTCEDLLINHYSRWYKIYPDYLTLEYKKSLNNYLEWIKNN